jgi:hypothetical protein
MMNSRLTELLDKPVIIRTLPEGPSWEPVKGIVFEVRDDAVDILIGDAVLKTVRMAAIVDVVIDEREARSLVLEAPPAHSNYRRARRVLFEAEQARYLGQPEDKVKASAAEAAELLRAVRSSARDHRGVELLLERAHSLSTGRRDYEIEPEVTSGDVRNHNYEWAKERSKKLDEALRLRRPEDEVAGHVAALARWAGRAMAKYPNHREIKSWFDKAETIRGKLSKDVQRSNRIMDPFVAGRD